MLRCLSLALLVLLLGVSAAIAEKPSSPLRAGIIGLDTSHVTGFTGVLNRPDAKGPLGDVRVVAAYPGGSPDLPISRDRIEGFTKTLREKYNVEIVDSIDALLKKVDVVLLESVDGRPHLAQARPVILAGKPLFIDKPVAASLADTIAIYELAAKHKVPCFSSSSLRFGPGLQKLARDAGVGTVKRCDAFGPINPLKGHPDLFFYGIHGIEMLFTIMGPGCETVTWQKDGLVTSTWRDGRVGTFSKGDYKVNITGADGTAEGGKFEGYEHMLVEMCKFFKTGKPPVSAEETINLVAFMTAAQQSKDNGHVPVSIDEVMKAAREKNQRTK